MVSYTSPKIPVDIAIPTYNEDKVLEKNVVKIRRFLTDKRLVAYKIHLVIIDNASTDNTSKIATNLAVKYKNVNYIRLQKKGRGRALRACFIKSKAQVLAYMDVDLSAELNALKPLLDGVAREGADIAIGSRLVRGAQVSGRTLTREIMSRGYNILIRLLFNTKFKDAQCGFKAINKSAFLNLEPLIENQNWFFDSELLIIAEKLGLTIKEIPITWEDDPSSTVKVATTALEDLAGLWRLKREKPWKKHLRK